MKKYQTFFALLAMLIALTLSITSCQEDSNTLEPRTSQNSIVYPPTSHPYGQSYAEWGFAWWQWAFGLDCVNNPITDPDGTLQNQNQSGPVYFLAGTSGATAVRNVTIPSGKAVLFPIICYINDYPCPDPNFQPAPGQSLEDFLVEGANAFMLMTANLSVTFDGTALTNLTNYRGTTGMATITGNPDLVNCLDGCITGSPQSAVSDGYWIMLKPLKGGQHTLHFHAEVPAYSSILDVTYNITIQ